MEKILYCWKCKKKVGIRDWKKISVDGKIMYEGECPYCHTKFFTNKIS